MAVPLGSLAFAYQGTRIPPAFLSTKYFLSLHSESTSYFKGKSGYPGSFVGTLGNPSGKPYGVIVALLQPKRCRFCVEFAALHNNNDVRSLQTIRETKAKHMTFTEPDGKSAAA